MKSPFAVLATLLLLASPARADGVLDQILTPFDKARLANFDQSSAAALREARAGGDPADVAVLDKALAGQPMPIGNPLGEWSCRVIKVGGTLPLTVYPRFKCTWREDGTGWFLEKTSGSQRTQGHFYDDGPTRLTYVGAGHVAGEAPRTYGQVATENQVAFAERRAANRITLMFPEPHYESKLDILVLER
jgi:hypothetical protein